MLVKLASGQAFGRYPPLLSKQQLSQLGQSH